jgi:hypothetical protein
VPLCTAAPRQRVMPRCKHPDSLSHAIAAQHLEFGNVTKFSKRGKS